MGRCSPDAPDGAGGRHKAGGFSLCAVMCENLPAFPPTFTAEIDMAEKSGGVHLLNAAASCTDRLASVIVRSHSVCGVSVSLARLRRFCQ